MGRDLDENQIRRDMLVVRARETVRKQGFCGLQDVSKGLTIMGNLFDKLEELNYEFDQFVKDISCDDVIFVQYGEQQSPLWYHDPFREKHLVEEISGIGPE